MHMSLLNPVLKTERLIINANFATVKAAVPKDYIIATTMTASLLMDLHLYLQYLLFAETKTTVPPAAVKLPDFLIARILAP